MFQEEQGRLATEFNQKHKIITNPQFIKFDEALLEYKPNLKFNELQRFAQTDVTHSTQIQIRTAILIASKGTIPMGVKRFFQNITDYNATLQLYKECLRIQQMGYFYFGGINSGIKVDKTVWPFQNGFAFCTQILQHPINYDEFNENNHCVQKILTVFAVGQQGSGGFECFIIRGSVYYRVIANQYTEPNLGNGLIYIGQLKNGWNFIGLSHELKKFSSAQLTVFIKQIQSYINNDQPKQSQIDFPKVPQNATVTKFTVCENLFGQAQSIIIMNQSSSKLKALQQQFHQYTLDFKQIKSLPQTLEKYFERIMTIYTPDFTDENRVFDLIGQSHGLFQPKSGAIQLDKNKFGQMGGFKVYLGMLQLAGMSYKQLSQGQINVNTLLQILNEVLKNNNHLQVEACHQNIFSGIASLISGFKEQLITLKFIETLQDTKQILFEPKLIDQFFIYLLWNPRFQQKCVNEAAFLKLIAIGSQFYTQNGAHFQQLLAFKDLMDVIVYGYPDSQCCSIHFNENERISYQIQLFEKVLFIFNQLSDIYECLLVLDQYLIVKAPPCLLIQLFNFIKVFFYLQENLTIENTNQQGKIKQILQIWFNNGIVKNLLFLFKSCPFYDVRSHVINLLNLIFQQQFQGYKLQLQESIELINSSIDALWEVGGSNKLQKSIIQQEVKQEIKQQEIKQQEIKQQEIKQSFQKQEKIEQVEDQVDLKNLGTQFLNNDYDSVPVAPSMTNRRQKQDQGFFGSSRGNPRALSIQPPEIEKPKKQNFSVDNKRKKFEIKIDTEAINALYSYGGEKGKKLDFDNEKFQQEMDEIYQLARQCVQHMEGKRDNNQNNFVLPQVRRAAPQTSRNSQPVKQEFPQLQQSSIKEVSSQSFSNIEQRKQYQSLNSTYIGMMGFLIDKLVVNQAEDLMIEEGDQIKNPGVFFGIIKILTITQDQQLKAQILQDLLCLTKSDASNSILMLGQMNCHTELLQILVKSDQNGIIWEIGSRFYVQLMSIVLKTEYIGGDYVTEAIKWADKNNFIKIYDILLEQIFDQVREDCKFFQPSLDYAIWKNIQCAGLNLLVYKEKLPKSLQKFRQILQFLFKECNIREKDVEGKSREIYQIFQNNLNQVLIRIAELLISQSQGVYFYEICLILIEKDQYEQLLLTFAITQEIYLYINNYPDILKYEQALLQIYFKLMNSRESLVPTQNLLLLIYAFNEKFQAHGFVYGTFKGLVIEFDIELETLMVQMFPLEKIKIFMEGFVIPQTLKIPDYPVEIASFTTWQTESLININKLQKDIQFYGEQKLVDQDEKRCKWLQFESEKDRIGKNLYYKSITRELMFDGWFSQNSFFDYSQKNEKIIDYDQPIQPSPLFNIQVSKWQTKEWYRPYLKVKPKIPQIFHNFNGIQFGTSSIPMITESKAIAIGGLQILRTANQILTIGKVLGNNIKNTIKTILPKQGQTAPQQDYKNFVDDHFNNKRVYIIQSLWVKQGYLQMNGDFLIFQYENIRQEQTHVSLAPFQLQEFKRLIKQYPLYNLCQVLKKKYLQRKTALELTFIDGKSLFINIPDPNDLDEIAQKLLRLRKTARCPFFQQNKTTDPIKIIEKQGYIQKWNKQQMSNFKYILLLNNLASRSYNDLTQYPILPWIIVETNKQQQEQQQKSLTQQAQIYPDQSFRELSKTMGAFGSRTRIKSYLDRFENADPNGEIPPFHYGSHYSSPAITAQYLIRLEPFTTVSKEIQGGKFDISDRIFYSMFESYRCATEDVADIRELIPEMFCLPEMFLNLSGLQFGKTQTDHVVNNVLLPQWAKGNPWKYVSGLRNALESEEIQKSICEWFDLIFGYKQRGKEADKALNKYFYLTYDNAINWEKIQGIKLSIETQIVNFGITPLQLFLKPHTSRAIEFDKFVTHYSSELKVYRPPNKKKIPNTMSPRINYQQAYPKAIVYIKWFSEFRLVCFKKEGKLDSLKWSSTQDQPSPLTPPFTCGLERERQINIEKPTGENFSIWDHSVSLQQFPVCVLNQGKMLVCGGYFGGRLIIYAENNSIHESLQIHTSTITVIKSDKQEQCLITGDKMGNVVLWKINQEYKLHHKQEYYDHQQQITQIAVNEKLKLFATACLGGLINVYNLYSGRFFRSFIHPNRNPIHSVVLSSRPLCCIIFQSSTDRTIFTYSINGFLIEMAQDDSVSMTDAQVIRNSLYQDILVYGNENGELIMRTLPFLIQFKRLPISQKSPVLSISKSKDKRFLICGCNDGEISVMAEPLIVKA